MYLFFVHTTHIYLVYFQNISYLVVLYKSEKLEDTKEVVKSRKSKTDIQYNGLKKKDIQYNGLKKKDIQYNGLKKKDIQYNGLKKKDTQWIYKTLQRKPKIE